VEVNQGDEVTHAMSSIAVNGVKQTYPGHRSRAAFHGRGSTSERRPKQKARSEPGLLSAMKQRCGPLPPPAAECEVYAGADDVLVERDRGGGAPQLAKPQDALPRSTNRYSALALQFGIKAYSRPTPAVQPTCVELMNGNAPAAASTFANAAPAVPYKRTRFQAHPARPRTVASQLLCVVQPTNAHDPLKVVSLKLVQSQSPSTPNTHGPV
jgi:hypothetical protein